MIPSRPQRYDHLRGRAQRFRGSKKPSFDEATLHKVLAGWGPESSTPHFSWTARDFGLKETMCVLLPGEVR